MEKYNLLLEAYLHADDKFTDKLEKIYRNNTNHKSGQIARGLIDIISYGVFITDKNVKQNYFDITDKDDLVSFTSPRKVKDNTNIDDIYSGKRDEIKIGKIIKSLSNDVYFQNRTGSITDKDIEDFVNIYKSISNITDKKFVIVNGDDIAKYYNSDKYFSKYGTLGSSCMKNVDQKFFRIYTENNKKVKLLLLLDDDDMVHGRALLWKLKKSPCDAKYFMDRVYTNKDSDLYKFINHAKENGFMYKENMNCHVWDNIKFIYDGKKIKGEIIVKSEVDFKKTPFLDTLCFLNKEKDELSNIPSKKCYWLHSTDGYVDRCYECDGNIIIDNSYCDECSSGLQFLINNKIKCSFKK